MLLSIFTDEINPDSPKRALDLAKEWGVTHVELRGLPSGRFPAVPDDELHSLHSLIDDAGLSVSGVSPGFCKCGWDDPRIPCVLSEHLPRACEWAKRCGTDLVSCFAFRRRTPESFPRAIIDLLGHVSEITRRHGCRLVLENEAGCWAATGLEAASIIRQVGSENVSLCWDPGNSCRAGSPHPFPNEYRSIGELVSHVHLKDFDPVTGCWCVLGNGIVDWKGQMAGFLTDGYSGFLVVETHVNTNPDPSRALDKNLSELERNTLQNVEFVRSCLKQGDA